jgi:hypothetical protein
MAIYLNHPPEFNTPAEVINYLYYKNDWNTEYETYLDEACQMRECRSHKLRSIDALIELIQTYFPDFEESDFIDTLFEVVELRKKEKAIYKYFYINYCMDIDRCTLSMESNSINSYDYLCAIQEEFLEDRELEGTDFVDLIEQYGVEEYNKKIEVAHNDE